jgi:hypothetical protein
MQPLIGRIADKKLESLDALYNYGLSHLPGTPALPRYGVRRRFACAMATIMIIAAACGFHAGITMVGHIVGWSLVAAAFVNVRLSTVFHCSHFFGKMVCGLI